MQYEFSNQNFHYLILEHKKGYLQGIYRTINGHVKYPVLISNDAKYKVQITLAGDKNRSQHDCEIFRAIPKQNRKIENPEISPDKRPKPTKEKLAQFIFQL